MRAAARVRASSAGDCATSVAARIISAADTTQAPSLKPQAPFRLRIILAPVRVLGIDYGARRIGLALSDATATLASPWRLLQRPPSDAATLRMIVAEVAALVQADDGLEAVVVGWPRRLDGTPNKQTPIVETFARTLEGKVTVPVVLQDERLSSVEAESRLAIDEKDWRKRKAKLDAAAAAVILQDYLDARPRAIGDGF
ncbi:MAG: Holliday junction resolvase RuvX [Acidobacteria bacterium]|nr:Holliday junction resolvase RuvX [Acidobacteriota bacterium]